MQAHMKTVSKHKHTYSGWHTNRELWDSLQQKLQSHHLTVDSNKVNI